MVIKKRVVELTFILLFFIVIFFFIYVSFNDRVASNNEIPIISAEHLDKDKNIIGDVYDLVYRKDNEWLRLKNSEFILVAFEKKLDNTRDITLYARSINNSSATIEVYSFDNILITQFDSITNEKWYKVYLDNLQSSFSSFYLKAVGDVEIDYIVDPMFGGGNISFIDPTPANATSTTNKSILFNISIANASNLTEIKWSWNNTNYTYYNDSLVLMYNFDNLSALGENDTHIFDASLAKNNGTVEGDIFDGDSGVNCTTIKYRF